MACPAVAIAPAIQAYYMNQKVGMQGKPGQEVPRVWKVGPCCQNIARLAGIGFGMIIGMGKLGI